MPIKLDRDVGATRPYLAQDLDADPAVLVQTGVTLLYGFSVHNQTAADAFLHLFNAAAITDVTVGTTAPNFVIPVAADATVAEGLPRPLSFPLGLVIASSTATDGATDALQDVSLEYA